MSLGRMGCLSPFPAHLSPYLSHLALQTYGLETPHPRGLSMPLLHCQQEGGLLNKAKIPTLVAVAF